VVFFSADGQVLAASAGPGRAVLHRLDGSGATIEFHISGNLSAVAFSLDKRWVAFGSRSQIRLDENPGSGPPFAPVPGQRAAIEVYELAAGRRVFSLPAGDWVSALAFADDDAVLLAASGEWRQAGKVLALESSSGRLLRAPADPIDAESAAEFSPDRSWIAAVASTPHGSVKLWRLK
jgi:hypothetical protein